MAAIRIKKDILEAMVRHAKEESPRECCGLLTGEDATVTHYQPMKNVLESNVRYEMDAWALLEFFKGLRVSKLKHLGIYHSHPASEAYPSETDVRESFYPECSYFIFSLKNADSPQVRAFQISAADIAELAIIGVD